MPSRFHGIHAPIGHVHDTIIMAATAMITAMTAFAPPVQLRTRLLATPTVVVHRPLAAPSMAMVDEGAVSAPQNASQVSEAMSGLMGKIAEYRSQSASLDEEERVAKRAEIIEMYQSVFVPACAFALANLGAYLVVVGVTLAGLKISGIGYAEAIELIRSKTDSAPWVESTLGKLDPQLGDLALALASAELAGPLIIAVTIAATPGTARALRARLAASGLDAAGASARLEEFLSSSAGESS